MDLLLAGNTYAGACEIRIDRRRDNSGERFPGLTFTKIFTQKVATARARVTHALKFCASECFSFMVLDVCGEQIQVPRDLSFTAHCPNWIKILLLNLG